MKKLTIQRIVILFICAGCGASALADLEFGPKELVLTGANPIWVPGYSVPSYVDWNNDGKKDLAVGAMDGKLRIYLNQGTDAAPDLAAAILAQNKGSDLIDSNWRFSPAIVDMDGDGKKDILAGNTSGTLSFYSNVGTDESPLFSGYTLALSEGQVIDLPGTPRSRPFVCDWTGDGYLDVLVGARDGNVHLYQGIPEPATMLLVGFGAMMLRRRR